MICHHVNQKNFEKYTHDQISKFFCSLYTNSIKNQDGSITIPQSVASKELETAKKTYDDLSKDELIYNRLRTHDFSSICLEACKNAHTPVGAGKVTGVNYTHPGKDSGRRTQQK